MRVLWAEAARRDRQRIFDFIAITEHVRGLLDNPQSGRVGRVPGTRERVIRRNYVLVYQLEAQGSYLWILRILHAAMQWPEA